MLKLQDHGIAGITVFYGLGLRAGQTIEIQITLILHLAVLASCARVSY